MRISKDRWAISLAALTAERSTCLRRHVGCVLLDKQGRVLSTGYNGVARGQAHCNQPTGFSVNPPADVFGHACPGAKAVSGTNLDGCHAIHAEQNALLQCKDIDAIHSCYVTTSPCMTCTKLLLNTGCQEIFFMDEYPQLAARDLWLLSGRIWRPIKD